MSYISDKKLVKDKEHNKIVCVATYEVGAEIIVKALNHYFAPKEKFTGNEAIEMMHNNTATAFKKTADFFEKNEYDAEEAIAYLREVADEIEAQALVVSMRDELKFDKPNP